MLPPLSIWDSTNKTGQQLTQKEFLLTIKEQNAKRKNESFCDYGIFLSKDGNLIGHVGLMNFVRSVTQSAFLGYRLFNRHWGKGYALEAVTAMASIAFQDHKLHRIVAGIEPKNKKSVNLVKKLNYRYEGVAKNVVFLRNKWQDLKQFALTTEDLNIKWQGHIEIRRR